MAVVTWWFVEGHGQHGEPIAQIIPLAVNAEGSRLPSLERAASGINDRHCAPALLISDRSNLLSAHLEPMLQREAQQRGFVQRGGFSARLLVWVEAGPIEDKLRVA